MEKNRVEEIFQSRIVRLGAKWRILLLLRQNLQCDSMGEYQCFLSEDEVLSLIKRVDCSDPQRKTRDFWDQCYERLLPFIAEKPTDGLLKYIMLHGYLLNTFFRVLGEDELRHNRPLQRKLCEIEKGECGMFTPKFSFLFFHYAVRYDLDDDLLDELLRDEQKYGCLLSVYKDSRHVKNTTGILGGRGLW